MSTFSQGVRLDPTDGSAARTMAAFQQMAAEGPCVLGPGLRWNRTERRLEVDTTVANQEVIDARLSLVIAPFFNSTLFERLNRAENYFNTLIVPVSNWYAIIQDAAASQQSQTWFYTLPSGNIINFWAAGALQSGLAVAYPFRGAANALIATSTGGVGGSSNFNDVPSTYNAAWIAILARKVAETHLAMLSLIRDLKDGKDILQ